MNHSIQVTEMNIHEVHPALYNPRIITESEMKKLCRSLQEFGCVDPIIINANGRIIGGHQRWEAAKKLGWPSVPCIQVDLDESKEKTLNLALNRISGDWDDEKLAKLLEEIQSDNSIDEILSGFDSQEIDDLLATFSLASFFDDEKYANRILYPDESIHSYVTRHLRDRVVKLFESKSRRSKAGKTSSK
ncbi:ParB N-terminal domain-containing protein [Planctomycetota bacterium]